MIKMELFREDALMLIAFEDLIYLDLEKRENILMDIYSENNEYESIKDYLNPKYNKAILNYLENSYKGVLNEYLQNRLSTLYNRDIVVVGKEEELFKCPCCGYKTLDSRGEYYICKVCFWEDDGSDDLDKYSNVNGLTLSNARINFAKYGACSSIDSNSVDKEGKLKYAH